MTTDGHKGYVELTEIISMVEMAVQLCKFEESH